MNLSVDFLSPPPTRLVRRMFGKVWPYVLGMTAPGFASFLVNTLGCPSLFLAGAVTIVVYTFAIIVLTLWRDLEHQRAIRIAAMEKSRRARAEADRITNERELSLGIRTLERDLRVMSEDLGKIPMALVPSGTIAVRSIMADKIMAGSISLSRSEADTFLWSERELAEIQRQMHLADLPF